MNEAWRQPLSREARNEHRKLRGAIVNALAVALMVTALVGDLVNPAVAEKLTIHVRLGMVGIAFLCHLFACLLVRDMEDR